MEKVKIIILHSIFTEPAIVLATRLGVEIIKDFTPVSGYLYLVYGAHEKSIDLLNLTPETDVDVLVNQILFEEPTISDARKPQLKKLIYKLIEKLESNQKQKFDEFKVLKAHILPLTNCAFNKNGDKFITGSYDRTCKVWDTITGKELISLEGHKNVVYTMAFNLPFGDKIVTGSFDRTAKIWDSVTGELLHTLQGHTMEIV